MARTLGRRKIIELEEALEGTEFFAADLATMPVRIDRLNADIDETTEVIERLLVPMRNSCSRPSPMPGWGCRAALDALAETGTDITRFHAGGNLGRVHPAGQPVRQAQRTFEVQELQRYLGGLLDETAVAAGRTRTREGARYRRLPAAAANPRRKSRLATPS